MGVYPDFLSDMKGYNYTVAALSYFPFVWKRGDEYSGLEVDMTSYLADRNNFRYIFQYLNIIYNGSHAQLYFTVTTS